MKKQTYAFIFAVTMAVMLNAGHAYGQFSEAIQADIPFAFSVGNKTLPEGNYTIRPAGNGRRMWRLQARDGKASQFLLAGNLSGVRGDQGLWLSFHRYGTKHYLAGFRTDSYQVGLPTSSSEKV